MTTAPGAGERRRIVVTGYLVRNPIGGLAWHYLQYVVGLHRMGHDVVYVEDSDDYDSCYDPRTDSMGTDPSAGLAATAGAMTELGLGHRWAYHDAHAGRWEGPMSAVVQGFVRDADVLLDVSGSDAMRELMRAIPTRVYVDTDPGFTQVRYRTDPARRGLIDLHNAFATFGVNIAAGGADVPDDGLAWFPTRQPVVPDLWPARRAPEGAPWTTVMHVEAYRPQSFEGRGYGLKRASLDLVRDLPQRTDVALEVALGGAGAPRDELRARGWRLVDPLEVGATPWTYRDFIAASRGELSIAKHAYVMTNCGWFSERTLAYLASGRPAVVQDTGFQTWLPTGEGVIPFSTLEEAVEGIARIEADHDRHARAARELVRDHFSHQSVLTELLDDIASVS